jgi:2-oxoglutarate dehydrogenase E2 component (dihydrolipoamide succinyltransferase)
MPALGESVTEGTVTQWLKKVGDQVAVDEPLVEISTDKVDTEIPSPFAGVLLEILVQEDEVAEVGAALAVLGEADEAPSAAPLGSPAPDAAQEAPPAPSVSALPDTPPPAPAPPPVPSVPEAGGADAPGPFAPIARSSQSPVNPAVQAPARAPAHAAASPEAPPPLVAAPQRSAPSAPAKPPLPPVATGAAPVPATGAGAAASDNSYVNPLVRKLAHEVGVDLATVRGSGVGGRIRREDVLAAVPPPPEVPVIATMPGDDDRLPRLRAIERQLHEVYQPTQLTSVAEVDVTQVVRLINRGRARFLEREGVELTPDPFFARATVEALKANPVFNAAIVDGDVTYYAQENLGVTVFAPSGPLVPVIADAGAFGLIGLAHAIAAVKARAAGGALLPSDLAAGTFTLTAPAGPDLMLDFPIIEPPQVAVLSIGAVTRRPVVVGEGIAVRSTSYLALSYDSRLITPSDAAKFLALIKQRLEAGGFEAELSL